MFGITRDALETVLKCLNGIATYEECQMAKEFIADLLERAMNSDDYIAFVSDVDAQIDIDEFRRHEEAIIKLSEVYDLSEELIEAIIDDYFEFMDGGEIV